MRAIRCDWQAAFAKCPGETYLYPDPLGSVPDYRRQSVACKILGLSIGLSAMQEVLSWSGKMTGIKS
jgi:hypothetical protein